MSEELLILLKGRMIGKVRKHHGDLSFEYKQDWRDDRAAYPLSLSMPLARKKHEGPEVRAYLEGLLPDSDTILRNWGRKFGVSHRSPFDLLKYVGEDCAGAVQFVAPDNLDDLMVERGSVEWLSEDEVAKRLRHLEDDRSAWRAEGDTGYFSLAGSQAKTALYFDGDRWGVPKGRTPTSHIVKPPMGDLRGVVENEHLCLQLARAAGIPAAESRVRHFDEQTAIVIKRYDRVYEEGKLERIHQEDVCQALGVPPTEKYENEGGPAVGDIAELLRLQSSEPQEDITTFVEALAFNWIIVGTDAHAKNYSVMLAPGGEVRLAPLYDVISVLPYDQFYPPRAKLAMKIGGEYRVGYIYPRHWKRLAETIERKSSEVLDSVWRVCDAVDSVLPEVCERARQSGLDEATVDQLEQGIRQEVRKRKASLEGTDTK